MAALTTVSDLLGFASIGCWLGAQFPQVVENYRRQSCEGLALPFLANWLLGDISNLIGCILTHQLPFQTWLATYFVTVDCMIMAQYIYYQGIKPTLSMKHGHGRSSTAMVPETVRRASKDRGTSRYRTMSTVAANVAAAAALAAQQEHLAPRLPRGRNRSATEHNLDTSSHSRITRADERGDEEEFMALADSFHSEGGQDIGRKRVSWSIERHRGRGGSVGRHRTHVIPTALQVTSTESSHNDDRGRQLQREMDDVDPSTIGTLDRRSSRASRKGSTMVFLGVWTLFGFGTLANNHSGMVPNTMTRTGKVLSTKHLPLPSESFSTYSPISMDTSPIPHSDAIDMNFVTITIENPSDPDHSHPDTPSFDRVLGRIFAWLCTTLYLTSRLPQIWKNFSRKSVEGLSMYLFVFAFLGNVFYVASILFSPRLHQPPPLSTAFLKESIPYLLGSGGTLMFDITIVTQSFIYRPHTRRRASTSSRLMEEESGLLAGDALAAHRQSITSTAGSNTGDRGRTSRSHIAEF